MTLDCPYCGGKAYLANSSVIYGEDRGDAYICENFPKCDSYVLCHENGEPYGTLADDKLRLLRQKAHFAFDPIWQKSKNRWARDKAYTWLSKELGIDKKDCHIGKFDIEQCVQTIRLSRRFLFCK